MKRTIRLLSILWMIIVMSACGGSAANGDEKDSIVENTDEIAYNDHIQDRFYGFSFGDSFDVVEMKLDSVVPCAPVKNKYGEVSFIPDYPNDVFEFGGFSWDKIEAKFSNDKLCGIVFLSEFGKKTDAMQWLNRVYLKLSKKYNLTEMSIDELSTIISYVGYVGQSKAEQSIALLCRRNERIREKPYEVCLAYVDFNHYQEDDESYNEL